MFLKHFLAVSVLGTSVAADVLDYINPFIGTRAGGETNPFATS